MCYEHFDFKWEGAGQVALVSYHHSDAHLETTTVANLCPMSDPQGYEIIGFTQDSEYRCITVKGL